MCISLYSIAHTFVSFDLGDANGDNEDDRDNHADEKLRKFAESRLWGSAIRPTSVHCPDQLLSQATQLSLIVVLLPTPRICALNASAFVR